MIRQAQRSKKKAGEQSTAKKVTAKESAKKQKGVKISEPQERHRMIAEAAYLLAEQRGFEGDRALDDWLAAEAEMDAESAAVH